MAKPPLTPLGSRRRWSARLALYAALGCSAVVGLGLGRVAFEVMRRAPEIVDDSREWVGIDFASRPEVDLLRRYVEIDTSFPDGDELAGARLLESEFGKRGIPSHIEYMGRGRANFWAILEGEEKGAVVLHHHIDVEEANDSPDWKFAPFAGLIEGPWMYGRGVYDMKSLAAAQMMALFELQRSSAASGRKPHKSVIFLGTSGEETGSDLGTKWILRQHPELVSRFEVVLTEGGVVEATEASRIKFWGIEYAQKHIVDVTFCSSDRARLEQLEKDLGTFGRPAWPLRLEPYIVDFVQGYGASRDLGLYPQLLARPDELLRRPEQFARLTPLLKSFFRNELYPIHLRPAVGGGYELFAKLHLFPDQKVEDGLAITLPAGLAAGVRMTVRDPGGARPITPLPDPAFDTIAEAVRELRPEAPVGPYYLTWSVTDSRFFRTAGIRSFGFSPFRIVASDTYYVGGPNERIGLAGYVEGVRLYSTVLRRLAQ